MVTVRKYTAADLPDMIRIWNQVVEDGIAFPQENLLDAASGAEFFAAVMPSWAFIAFADTFVRDDSIFTYTSLSTDDFISLR